MPVAKRYLILVAVILVLVACWTGWWFHLAGQVETRTREWIGQQAAQGTRVSYSSFSVTGYPYRIEAAMSDLKIEATRAPGAPVATIPRLVVLGLPWRADLIDGQVEGPVALSATDAAGRMQQATYAAGATTFSIHLADGQPDRIAVSMTAPTISGPALPGPVAADLLEIHLRRADAPGPAPADGAGSPDAPLVGELALDATRLRLPLPQGLPPFGGTIDEIGTTWGLRGILPAGGDVRAAATAWREAGGTVDVSRLRLRWGKLDADLTGTLALDRQFRPEGAISGRVGGLADLIDGAVAQGRLAPDQAKGISRALGAFGLIARDKQGRLPVSVTLQDGVAYFGPLPLARLPPLL